MGTKALTAFGMTLNIDEEVVKTGYDVLDKLRQEKEAPMSCIRSLAMQLELTNAEATALYAAWLNNHKPVF